MTAVRNTSWPDRFVGHPQSGSPLSINELQRAVGGGRGPHYNFLRRFASKDVVYFFDDFLGTLNGDIWSTDDGGGAGAAVWAYNLALNGTVLSTTGTANNDTASNALYSKVAYPGYSNCGIEVRARVRTVASNIELEVGFIDAVPGAHAPGISDHDTPTAPGNNLALISINTAATANQLNFYTKGNATSQEIKKTAGVSLVPVVDVWQTFRVQLLSNEETLTDNCAAKAWVDGKVLATHDNVSTLGVGAVKGSVLLTPWIRFAAKSAATKSLQVDYVALWHDRI